MHFLLVESETADEREQRRASVGKSAGESFAATLQQLVPGCAVDFVEPADSDADMPTVEDLQRYDAVFLSGSPLHVYDPSPEAQRQVDFMRAVFASGTPSFGSCAGLRVAVAAAGGRVRQMPEGKEAGVARRITATAAGRNHPLLAGRPAAWDAPAVHGDEVEALPPGAVLLASNGTARVQAAEIRHGAGVFWGVQYHPELAPGEIAAALRRQSGDLVEAGLADQAGDVEAQAELLDRLHEQPDSRAVRWRLGVDDEFASEPSRRRELRNFLDNLAQLDGRPPVADTQPLLAAVG